MLAANILKILIMSKYIKSFWFIVNKLVVFLFHIVLFVRTRARPAGMQASFFFYVCMNAVLRLLSFGLTAK